MTDATRGVESRRIGYPLSVESQRKRNMTTESTERLWSGLDAWKVIAGTLAAVTAAVLASVLGVAGTLVGAAVASLVGTVGQELYAQSLRRGYSRLRDPRQSRVSASAATPGTVAPHHAAGGTASTAVLRSSAAHAQHPTAAHPVPAYPAVATGRPRWRTVMLATLAAFALAMILVSAVELLSGRALAAMFGDDSAGASTISSVVDGPRDTAETPAPDSTTDAPTTAPTTAPAIEPTTAAPTDDAPAPTVAPTVDGEPTVAPTAEPAQQTAPAAVGRSARP